MHQAKVFLSSQELWGKYFCFDGVSTGWSPEDLIPGAEGERTSMVNLPNHTAEKPNQVEVAIRKAGILKIAKLVDFIDRGYVGQVSQDPEIEDCFRALNCLFRDDPQSRFITVDKSSAYFIRTLSLVQRLDSTGGVLEAIRGVFQSVSNAFGRPGLTIDTKTIAMYTPDLSMMEVAAKFSGVRNPDQIDRSICEESLAGMWLWSLIF